MTAKSIESLEAGWSYLSLIQSSATFTGLGCTRSFTLEELLITIVIIDKWLAVVRGGNVPGCFISFLVRGSPVVNGGAIPKVIVTTERPFGRLRLRVARDLGVLRRPCFAWGLSGRTHVEQGFWGRQCVVHYGIGVSGSTSLSMAIALCLGMHGHARRYDTTHGA